MAGNHGGGLSIPEALYAKEIGKLVLDYLKTQDVQGLAEQADTQAVALLTRIKAILDDSTLSDPECFWRIEAMVDAFHDAGIGLSRHDW